MRLVNTVRNTVVSLLFQIITLLIGFIVPRWVIATYGSEVNGLTSNINQIVNIINLLQAGIVGASIFEMYKPITEENFDTIGKIYYTSKSYFKKVSWIFFSLTLLIIPYIFLGKETTLEPVSVVLSVIILGINATFLFKYYCSYDVIFSAFQQKYKLIIASGIEKFVYYLLLFIILLNKYHYIWMYLVVFIGSVCKILYLNHEFNKIYKLKIIKWKKYSKYKIKNQYHLFGNQIVQNLIETTPVIIVTVQWGLVKASIISIYMLVINIFKVFFSTLQNSIAASFGDLAAYGDNKKVLDVFKIIQYVFWLIGSITCITCILLLLTFVQLYCSETDGVSYLFMLLSILITIYIYCYIQFLPYNLLVNSLGLYGTVLKANIFIGVISFISSAIMSFFDFQLVYIGIIIFYFLSVIHRHFFIISAGYKVNIKCLMRCLIVIVFMALCAPFIGIINNSIKNWTDWIIFAFLITVSISFLFFLYSFFFDKDELKKLYQIKKIFMKGD